MALEVFTETVYFVSTIQVLRWVILGILIGIFFGAIPGVSASIGMVVFLPLTLSLDGIPAIILLVSIYSGAIFGGSISTILLEPPMLSENFEGKFPIKNQDTIFSSVSLAATATAIAGILTAVAVIVFSPFLIRLVSMFGSAEYFLVVILGIAVIAFFSRGSMAKGLVAGFFGLSLTTVGAAPMTADIRYTFGYIELYTGIAFVPVLIGLFAIAGMMNLSGATDRSGTTGEVSDGFFTGVKTVITHPVTVVKSAFIGMGFGVIPGIESADSNAKPPFGATSLPNQGAGNSLGAMEATRHGTIGGAVIPALSFGIPGTAATAVLIGGLILHGMVPGSQLFEPNANLDVTYAMLIALIFGNVVIFCLGLGLVRTVGYLPALDSDLIVPSIVVLAFLGGFSLRGEWIDLITLVGFGILGYYMMKFNYSIVAFIVGILLGPIMEENLFRALLFSDGPVSILTTEPVSMVLFLLLLAVLFVPLIPHLRRSEEHDIH